MRRSKSNPARYTRNYRSISQRRMTKEYDDCDDEKEMERLRQVLRQSEAHLARADNDDCHADDEPTQQRKRKQQCRRVEQSQGLSNNSELLDDNHDDQQKSDYANILSQDMLDDMEGDAENPLVLPSSSSRKKKAKRPRIELTPQEIRQAKHLQKKTAKKLKQLETRAAQKKKRAELYTKLQTTAISKEKMELLSSSASLGKKRTKRERLKRLLQKERAGIELTESEKDLLYQDRAVPDAPETESSEMALVEPSPVPSNMDTTRSKEKQSKKGDRKLEEISEIQNGPRRKQKVQPSEDELKSITERNSPERKDEPSQGSSGDDTISNSPMETHDTLTEPAKSGEQQASSNADTKPLSFAAQMMASLTTLKTASSIQAEKAVQERQEAERKKKDENDKRLSTKDRYIPTEPVVLKTAATLGLRAKKDSKPRRKVREITRPEDVRAVRNDLPVAAMEFEVMDALCSNDVTILCSETGSGKSTQVPQFLYEYGLTRCAEEDPSSPFLVGVTQPRRIAAISAAKRVCYEMGQGNGQIIPNGRKGKGNMVAYQTRYETAGLGTSTHIKFMTDGILLQEIQSDLLLRKYSVIVLDEAHERCLNTDILIGLLSVALPLRKQAAKEEGSKLVPLKIVIMSATLRIEDFTGNKNLFATEKPTIVKIPGRMHPVTIHHSKVTELDDYEEAVFRKTCKIHRKLPQGGVLVFLTGRREIIRMVNRLRRALNPSKTARDAQPLTGGKEDVSPADGATSTSTSDGQIPRDMDDDEIDGELFRMDGNDDYDDLPSDDEGVDGTANFDAENGIPKKAVVLPLYSLLSAEEQAKVFASVPEGHRLIVVATNVAETSVTIPGISYVVDSGRQKCRNFNAATGVASFDIMWISKAAADQRAGRAGRVGPGHCYRLYSSSMYSRHMEPFALPEVLARPLEDVVLQMKAMKISNVADFPFPTPPDQSQIEAAVRILANIGCVDVSKAEEKGGDGEVTRLGTAVAKLPLGVRYGKMLLVAAQAGVLDYAIAMVAALSESDPFLHGDQSNVEDDESKEDGSDQNEEVKESVQNDKGKKSRRWMHKGGDVLAAMLAVGAYTFAGRNSGGASERMACKNFCQENGLNPVIMERIQKMRIYLARLAKVRLGIAEGVAAKTGGILSSMPPPNKLQERLLCQAVASSLLDNVALLAPLGSIPGEHPFSLRSAYLSCSSNVREPLFMDRNSAVYSRDSRRLPQWICYGSLMRKTLKDGTSVAIMKTITPIDPSWLGPLARGSSLLYVGEPLPSPLPFYDSDRDAVLCSVKTKFGSHGWEIPPLTAEMFDALQTPEAKQSSYFTADDSFRWFARFLFEGKVLPEVKGLEGMLNDSPALITRRAPVTKVALLVSALSSAGVDSAAALQKHWAEVDNKFLFKHLKSWVKNERVPEAKKLWIDAVKQNVRAWSHRRDESSAS